MSPDRTLRFNNMKDAHAALTSGASFAIVEMALQEDEEIILNMAMEKMFDVDAFACIDQNSLPFYPATLEGRVLMLISELTRKASRLLDHERRATYSFLHRTILACAEIGTIEDQTHVRGTISEDGSKGVDQWFHLDCLPESVAPESEQYLALVTLGDYPGTQLVLPGEATRQELDRLARLKENTIGRIKERGFKGSLIDQPELIDIYEQCDLAVKESEIHHACAYQIAFVRYGRHGQNAPGIGTWHRAPMVLSANRGLLAMHVNLHEHLTNPNKANEDYS